MSLRLLLGPLAILACVSPAPAQFGASVPLPGDLSVGPSAGSQQKPALCWGATHFLAVWEDARSALGGFVSGPNGLTGNLDVYGVLLDANGLVAQAAPIVISQAAWDQTHPRVAWNGSNFLVVWESTRPTQSFHTQGVFATRVSPTGQVLDEPPIVIDDSDAFDERFPVVTSDGTNWVVAWTDQPTSTAVNLNSAVVDGTGLVLLKKVLVPATSPLPTNYALAYAQNRFGLVFERNGSGGVAARLYDGALNQVGGELALGTGTKPAIGSNGNDFYAAWIQGGVRGTPISATGSVAIPAGALLSGSLILGAPGVAVAWNGSGWSATFDDYLSIHAAHVDVAGILSAGSPFVVSSGSPVAEDPAAAAGPGFALTLWTDLRNASSVSPDPMDVYGAVLPPGSLIASAYPIAVSPPAQVRPALAGDANAGYLCAFESRGAAQSQIVAQRLDALGQPLDPQPIVLASTSNGVGPVDVGWDGSEWLVVWHEPIGTSSPLLYRTFARRVRADGSLPEAQALDLMNGSHPQVAAVGGAFLVSAHWHYPPVQSNEIYHFKRLAGATGVVLDPVEVLIGGGSGTSDLAGFDDRWLLAWGGIGITGAFILADGTVQTAFVAADAGGSGNAQPCLARNGDEVLLGFVSTPSQIQACDVRARRIRKDGTLLDLATGTQVSSAPNGQFLPAAAWLGDTFLLTYTDYRDHSPIEPGLGDVFGARVSATNQLLDAPDLPVQDRWSTAEGRSAVAGANGRAIVLSAVAEAGAFGTWRVHVQTGQFSAGTSFCAGDGSGPVPCPCGNNGSAQKGCQNSLLAGGAALSTIGFTNPDSVVLRVDGVPPTALAIFLQGTQDLVLPASFGDGLRCVGGVLKRLYVHHAVAGSVVAPVSGELGIRQQSAALGDPIQSGSSRSYQVYYRDPSAGFCPAPQGATFNVTNGMRIQW